eukprot:201844-Rhodomonas_salina.1
MSRTSHMPLPATSGASQDCTRKTRLRLFRFVCRAHGCMSAARDPSTGKVRTDGVCWMCRWIRCALLDALGQTSVGMMSSVLAKAGNQGGRAGSGEERQYGGREVDTGCGYPWV